MRGGRREGWELSSASRRSKRGGGGRARGPRKPDGGDGEGALPCRARCADDDDDDGGGNGGSGSGGGGADGGGSSKEGKEKTRRRRGEGRVLPSVDLCLIAWPTWRLALRKVRRADRRGGLEGSAGILVKADSSFACS